MSGLERFKIFRKQDSNFENSGTITTDQGKYCQEGSYSPSIVNGWNIHKGAEL